MKKALLFSMVSFLVGTGMAFLVLVNPFHWEVLHTVQTRLTGAAAHDAEMTPGGGQLWTCGMHPQVIQDEPGQCPICRMDLTPVKQTETSPATTTEREVKHWRAPMDPGFVSDKPGKSPMGMDLIPVYEDEEGADGLVTIDPVFVQNIGVQSVPVERRDIPYKIRTIGTIAYDDRQLTWVTTKYDGWLEKVYVNYVGEPVQAGQRLFDIYSPLLVGAQEEYLQALEYSRKMSSGEFPDIAQRAQSLLDSARQRLRYWDVGDEQIEELERTGRVQRTIPVLSPVDGQVVAKMDQSLEGMNVKPGMNLYKLVDLSMVWVEADIFEHQIEALRIGQAARVELPSRPGRTLPATIRFKQPFVNRQTRTSKVSLELANPDGKLREGMYVNVDFAVPAARGVLVVPEEAVLHSGTRNIVVTDRGNGRFQVKEVELGLNAEGLWAVETGLDEGEMVVVSSQFLIDSEANLRQAIRNMVSRRGR